jgi:hypothetical protein
VKPVRASRRGPVGILDSAGRPGRRPRTDGVERRGVVPITREGSGDIGTTEWTRCRGDTELRRPTTGKVRERRRPILHHLDERRLRGRDVPQTRLVFVDTRLPRCRLHRIGRTRDRRRRRRQHRIAAVHRGMLHLAGPTDRHNANTRDGQIEERRRRHARHHVLDARRSGWLGTALRRRALQRLDERQRVARQSWTASIRLNATRSQRS